MTAQKMRVNRWIALIILLLGCAAMALPGVEKPDTTTATLPSDAESTVTANLQAQISEENSDGGKSAQPAIVLFELEEDGATLGREQLGELQGIAEELGGPLIPNEELNAAMVPVQIESTGYNENKNKVMDLRDSATEQAPEGMRAQVTGPAAIQADLSNVFSGANFILLGVTAAIVAVLLIITYRSPVLWLIPLIVIAVADRAAAILFTYVLDAAGIPWDDSTAGILSVLVFGAGTNYALLLISRYRDELTGTDDRFEAMSRAWLPTLKTVTASAATVIIGVLCLLASSVGTTKGLGLASAAGIVVAWVFALFCLPGILVLFDRWIFWPKKPVAGEEPDHKLWDKVGGFVRRKPLPIAIVSLVILGLSSIGYFQSSTGLNQADQFLDTPESITAAEDLGNRFPEQSATPALVATTDPESTTVAIEAMGGTPQPQGETEYAPADQDPAQWTLLQVNGVNFQELRSEFAGENVFIGGQDAQLFDAEEAAADDRQVIFPLVLGLVFIALLVLLRAFVAPVIMVASVLLTNVAALGLSWWISTSLLGFERFDSLTPLYAFVFLVALGIDYTIFLVTRAREEAGKQGTKEGILTALSATGGVITSAGILLAAVFAALGVLPLVVMAQLGITVFIGVLLDTLIVRTILVPSLVQLLGEKFWWPAKPAKDTPADAAAAGSGEYVNAAGVRVSK